MRMVAVVLAGGSGQRFGAEVPKQLLELDGRTLLEHCVAAFDAAPGVDDVLVVMPPGRTADAEKLLAGGGYGKLAGVIEGGTTRPGSTRAAIAAIGARRAAAGDDAGVDAKDDANDDANDDDWGVLFHDAARPLVGPRIIADCVAALERVDAIGVAVPTSDTIVVVEDGVMTQIPRRETLRRCQTPQGFRLSVIARAHDLALADPDYVPTDDCGVVLRYLPDVPVHVVEGSERNLKVTYPRDLAIAGVLLGEDQNMAVSWTPEQLERIDGSDELEIASRRADGTLRQFVPIWVVRVDGQVYVRTWHRRPTGWFGQVLASHRARVRVPGLEADVVVEDVGEGPGELRSKVDEAYRAKYARYGHGSVDQMVAGPAVAATLRLIPADGG